MSGLPWKRTSFTACASSRSGVVLTKRRKSSIAARSRSGLPGAGSLLDDVVNIPVQPRERILAAGLSP